MASKNPDKVRIQSAVLGKESTACLCFLINQIKRKQGDGNY